ncbi:unnamed protein product [Polarella glacialis]|uniref:nicotinamidase n=1 Tax=Polarella glacialis TaxID=89957 RepID=A0A813DN71_POLGL|nr:unnamed protein product [Polarella glacialis]
MGSLCSRAGEPAPDSPAAEFRSRSALLLTDAVFNKYDKDGNGELDVKELSALMADAFPEQPLTQEELKVMMQALDLNQDGKVGANELRAFLRCYDPKSHHIKTKTALIIIDAQNDFITGTLANPYNGQQIVPIINGLRDKVDLVVISYDWHPEEHCSFVESANAGKIAMLDEPKTFEPFTMITLKGDADRPEHQQMLYPRHAVQDTWGGKCHEDLVLKDTDKVIYKGTKPNIDSYSAFFDNCKANDTGLLEMLQSAGVTDVYCAGLVFDICVKSTALHGAELGFNMLVIHDACKPLSDAQVEPTKAVLASAGVDVLSVDEAVGKLSARKDRTLKEFMSGIRRLKPAKRIHREMDSMSSHALLAGPGTNPSKTNTFF